MDIKVGLSIYNKPWLIEPNAALQLLEFFELIKEGKASWNYRKVKAFDDDYEDEGPTANEILQKFFAREGVAFCPTNKYDLRDFKGFDGAKVAVIPIFGPTMKSDFCGDFGTASLRNMARVAAKTKSVETVIFHFDTPGGSVDGTKAFVDDIKDMGQVKDTISFADGICCSAGIWKASAANRFIASSTTDIIGSIGTMCSWYDNTDAMKERGIVLREYYATKSEDKNKMFREATKGNGKLLIQEMLDPMNNEFLQSVAANREGKIDLAKHDVFTGKTYLASKAQEYGLIDGIASLEQVIGEALNKSKPNKTKNMKVIAFASVLVAAQAEAFQVVDGGFLLTEDNLNAIDAKLEQNETVLSSTAKAIAAFELAAADADASGAALTAANAKIATLEAAVESAMQKVATLEAAAKDYQSGAKQFFGKTGTEQQDPPPPHEQDEQTAIDNLPHNRKADEYI